MLKFYGTNIIIFNYLFFILKSNFLFRNSFCITSYFIYILVHIVIKLNTSHILLIVMKHQIVLREAKHKPTANISLTYYSCTVHPLFLLAS